MNSIFSEGWFKLFASCVVVEGISSSLIYDLERKEFYNISDNILELLNLVKDNDISELKEHLTVEQKENMDVIFQNFIDNELGFVTREPERYPPLDFHWFSPHRITNAIIELDQSSKYNLIEVMKLLNELSCKAIQIRLLESYNLTQLQDLIAIFNDLRIKHVELMLPFENDLPLNALVNLMKTEPRLNKILIYGGKKDEVLLRNKTSSKLIVVLAKDIRLNVTELINVDRFSVNIESFSEAKNFNLGLNRKVCINKDGEIKNYLTHNLSFGHVSSVDLQSIIESAEFQRFWYISNDKIEICKDCQYRYACVSNSDMLEENDLVYKKDKCNYNPYIDQWQE